MKRIMGWTALSLFAFVTISILALSPHTHRLFGRNSDRLESVLSFLAISVVITVGVSIAITAIVASCMLAERLGYEQMTGLLLLIPCVNIIVFFYWAFRESPNEQKLRLLKQRTESVRMPTPDSQYQE